MHSFFRSGRLLLGSAAVFSLLVGCQSPQGPEAAKEEAVPAAPDPAGRMGEATHEREQPSEAEARQEEVVLAPAEREGPKTRGGGRSIEAQADKLGATVRQLEDHGFWEVSKGQRSLLLKESSRIAALDGVTVFLDEPFTQGGGHWSLGESDQRLVLQSAFGDRLPEEDRSVYTVVVDPGHGGSQSGTTNEALGILEKDLTLDVSTRLQGHLERLGFKVVLTRYEDRLVGLEERSALANGLKADLFLSIHFNAAYNKEAKGFETYMLTPSGYPSSGDASLSQSFREMFPGNRFDRQNFEFSFRIQNSLVEALGRTDRGVKKARFLVLKGLQCPGALVECGFVSHQEESLLVSTAGYRERVAKALADAISGYARGSGASDS